jgi:hypothetical protein
MSVHADATCKVGARGSTLLEQALTLPVLLGFIVAAVDLTSVLQTRSALEQGVKNALRCSYPVDGQCVENRAATAGSGFYDWRRYTYPAVDAALLIDYDGAGELMRRPTHHFDGIRARVLTDLELSFTTEERSAKRHAYGATGSFQQYQVDHWFPPLSGGNLEDPEFGYDPSRTWENSSNVVIGPSPARGEVSSLVTNGLTVALPQSSTPAINCTARGRSCEGDWGRRSYEGPFLDPVSGVYLTIHVRGESIGTDPGAATLWYRYRRYGGSNSNQHSYSPWTSLTGQSFRGNATANFIPRGLPHQAAMNGMAGNQAEIGNNRFKIKAVRDRGNPDRTLPFQVRVSYAGSAGNASYLVSDIRVWGPRMSVEPTQRPCSNLVPHSVADSAERSCTATGNSGERTVHGELVTLDTPRVNRDQTPLIELGRTVRISDQTYQLNALRDVLRQQSIADPENFLLSEGVNPRADSLVLSCPENDGIASGGDQEWTTDGEGACSVSEALAQERSALTETPRPLTIQENERLRLITGLVQPSAEVSAFRWRQGVREVAAPFTWLQPDCTRTTIRIPEDLPPHLASYAQIQEVTPSSRPVSYTREGHLPTGAILSVNGRPASRSQIVSDPALAPQWNCSEIGTLTMSFGGEGAPTSESEIAAAISQPSLTVNLACRDTTFGTPQRKRLQSPQSCAPLSPQTLAVEAENCGRELGFTPNTFFTFSEQIVGEETLRPATEAERGCFQLHRTADRTAQPVVQLIAENVPNGTTPAACQNLPAHQHCGATIRRIEGGSAGQSSLMLQSARSLGSTTIATAVPRSAAATSVEQCAAQEGACHTVEVIESSAQDAVQVRATAYVPMLSLLGGRIPVTFADSEPRERNLVR